MCIRDSDSSPHALSNCIAHIGGTVDAYRTRRHLRDGHYVRELLQGEPVLSLIHIQMCIRDSTSNEWLEPVTDEEYDKLK